MLADHSPELPVNKAPAGPSGAVPFTPLALADLETAAQSQAPWLWQGYLARGSVTMLTSQWKSGKTTLVAVP